MKAGRHVRQGQRRKRAMIRLSFAQGNWENVHACSTHLISALVLSSNHQVTGINLTKKAAACQRVQPYTVLKWEQLRSFKAVNQKFDQLDHLTPILGPLGTPLDQLRPHLLDTPFDHWTPIRDYKGHSTCSTSIVIQIHANSSKVVKSHPTLLADATRAWTPTVSRHGRGPWASVLNLQMRMF